jgi:hypothetical protein
VALGSSSSFVTYNEIGTEFTINPINSTTTGDYTILVILTDNGTPPLSSSYNYKITVLPLQQTVYSSSSSSK